MPVRMRATLTLFGTTEPDVTQILVPANTLPFNSTIYWRVDTISGDKTVAGTVWSFDTVKQYPVIRVDVAPLTVVDAGATANLKVIGHDLDRSEPDSDGQVRVVLRYDSKVYEGIPIGPDADLNYDCPLTLANVQLAKEGVLPLRRHQQRRSDQFFEQGSVLTHRMMLHYTFESVTGNVIPDQSASGFNATLICPAGGPGVIYGGLADGGLGLGKAIKLLGPADPNNAYITTNKKPMELGISGNFPRSISVWAKAMAFNDAGLFDMGVYVERQNFCLRTMAATEGTWRVQYYAAGPPIPL